MTKSPTLDKQKTKAQCHVGQAMISIIYGALGAALLLLLLCAIMPRVMTPTPVTTTAQTFAVYTWNSDAKPDDANWRLVIKDMVDAESLRIETRLRDHFTLLLALAGISTALILGLFSLSQSRREEEATERLEKMYKEAEKKLERIREYEKESHNALMQARDDVKQQSMLKSLSINQSFFSEKENQPADICLSDRTTEKNALLHDLYADPVEPSHNSESDRVPPTEAPKVHETFADAVTSSSSLSTNSDQTGGTVEKNEDNILQLLRKNAENGRPIEQLALGTMLATGRGAPIDETEAARWFRKAAEQGDPRAQFNLGIMFMYGRGVEKNDNEAVQWFYKAAKQDERHAQFNLGKMLLSGRGVPKDETEAARWFRKAAEQNDPRAQQCLGAMLCDGRGVSKNETEAACWFRKAAEQDYPNAQLCLGIMLYNGRGVSKNETEAALWFRKAAEQGLPQAQYNFGIMLIHGNGVDKDENEASMWFRKAAEQGDPMAQLCLGIFYDGKMEETSDAEATYWYLQAALQGLAAAVWSMALRYYYGIGVPENYIESYAFLSLYKSLRPMGNEDQVQTLYNRLREQLTPDQIARAQSKATELWENIQKKNKLAQ